jgi:hypothetical protein
MEPVLQEPLAKARSSKATAKAGVKGPAVEAAVRERAPWETPQTAKPITATIPTM